MISRPYHYNEGVSHKVTRPLLITITNHYIIYCYCNRKVTGIVNWTFTTLPFWRHGIHLCIVLTTLKASASSRGSLDFLTFAFVFFPSFVITKVTITRPLIPFSAALGGYFIFFTMEL